MNDSQKNAPKNKAPKKEPSQKEPTVQYGTFVEALRDGRAKATIWKRQSGERTFYTTSFAEIYEDKDGNLRDGKSFTDINTLKLTELARRAYLRIDELKQADRARVQNQAPQRGPSQNH